MAGELTYNATVTEDGTMKIINRQGFNCDMKSLFSGKKVIMKIKQYRKSRSNKQNGYYHSCVIPIVLDGLIDAGFEKSNLNREIVHEMLKQKFLTEDISNDNGEFISVVKSTTELTTSGMMDYIAAIQQWGAEFLGINIPDPGEQSLMEFN